MVSLIEFHRDLVLIEEENGTETCFYTDRTIRIFVASAVLKRLKFETIYELRKILKKSMLAAQNNITKLVNCEDGDIAFDDGVSLDIVNVLIWPKIKHILYKYRLKIFGSYFL